MKKRISWSLIGVFLIAGLCWVGYVSAAADPVTLQLYNPTGAFEVTQTFAPRVADLNGKTICELSNNGWEHARTFPLIRELLQRQYPTVKIIPYTEFPNGNPTVNADNLGALVKAKGCQAAIVGNAG